MSVVKFFNIYSLDFSHLKAFKEKVSSQDDELKSKFQLALEGDSINTALKNSRLMKTTLSSIPSDESPSPFAKVLEGCTQSIEYSEGLLNEYEGADPFAIQELVHEILGISNNTKSQASDEARAKYFSMMKESGFLNTHYTSINRIEEQPIVYRPHVFCADFLNEHPETQTLLIGCGAAAQSVIASCYFRVPDDHKQSSLAIDISAGIGPHLVVDMHDADFWKSIPDERFERILDHTYGHFLFEDQRSVNTIQEIYRTLKPGGYLKLDHAFDEPMIAKLKEAGFAVEPDELKIAKKVLV